MPPDSPIQHGPLRGIIETTLRDDIHTPQGGMSEATPQLPGALARICADAKRRGLRVEQLIVLIKEVWLTVPVGRNGLRHVQSQGVLAGIITTIIDCYYAG